eukprot:jgi/Chrzof1/7886/Cz02g40010.t1
MKTSPDEVTIVELRHNTHPPPSVVEHKVTAARLKELLADPEKVKCPMPEKLGFPLALVSTQPGQQLIPETQFIPVSNNVYNNRPATVMASRLDTGLAVGCVVGDVYAIRTDEKSFTVREWAALDEYGLNYLMDCYPDGAVTEQTFQTAKANVMRHLQQQQQGSVQPYDDTACAACGQAADELKRCSRCKGIWYCGRDCQRMDWPRHKTECEPV